jgi:hypothetical protein
MFPDSLLNMTALAFLGMTVPLAATDTRTSTECIPLVAGSAIASALVPDAGGFSRAANDHLAERAGYLRAFVETANGDPHPDVAGETDITIFTTLHGHIVVRIRELRVGQ